MIRIAICDDEQAVIEHTTELVSEYCSLNFDNDYTVIPFTTSFSLLDAVEKGEKFDIFILDIVMPNMNGIDLGGELIKIDNTASIILLSSSREFGIESYSIKAIDYVLKPCSRETLFSSLDRATLSIKNSKINRFVIDLSGGVYAIPLSKILYVEYFEHRLLVHTTDNETVEGVSNRKPFSKLILPLIENGEFVQISASYLVNMRYIKKLKTKEIELYNGKSLPLSRTYQKARSIYLDYVLGEN